MRQLSVYIRVPLHTAILASVLSYVLAFLILISGNRGNVAVIGASSTSEIASGALRSSQSSAASAASKISGSSSSAVSAVQEQGNLKLMDISHYNTITDWNAVKQAVDGIYIKATEGTTVIDPKFQTNAQEASKAGISVGFYHYFWPTDAKGAAQQADYFYDSIRKYANRLRPALDIEESNRHSAKEIAVDVQAFEAEFYRLAGTDAMLYSSPNFANAYLTDQNLSAYPLWIASYNSTSPETPVAWKAYQMWQYGKASNIDGVVEPVDVDFATPAIQIDGIADTALQDSKND